METPQEIKDLVIARLGTLPTGKGISIGSNGELSKEEAIKHVENDDNLGKTIIEVEMNFLRALKEGTFYTEDYAIGNTA